MRKFIDFIKKPLLIISSIVFAVFAVVLIAVSSQSHGKKYEYSDSFLDVGVDITMTFKTENTLVLEMFVGKSQIEQVNQYRINDGELYTYNSQLEFWGRDGEIDAYEIELEFPVDSDLGILSGMELELICKQNIIIRNISIVMMAVFGVIAVCSLAVLVLDKKGILNKLLKTEASSVNETSAEVSAEAVLPESSSSESNLNEVVSQSEVAPEQTAEIIEESDDSKNTQN